MRSVLPCWEGLLVMFLTVKWFFSTLRERFLSLCAQGAYVPKQSVLSCNVDYFTPYVDIVYDVTVILCCNCCCLTKVTNLMRRLLLATLMNVQSSMRRISWHVIVDTTSDLIVVTKAPCVHLATIPFKKQHLDVDIHLPSPLRDCGTMICL